MRMLGILLASVMLVCPGLAAGQAVPPVAEPPTHLPVEAPLPFFVAQRPAAFPPSPPGDPRLGPGDPTAAGPLGPPRSIRMMPPAPRVWWKDSEIVKKLELSEAQVGRIEQTFLEYRLRLIDLRADLEKQELGLQPLLDADRPDEAKVAAQIDLITTARGKLEKENALMLLAIRQGLSVEQWKRLQAFQQERGPGSRLGPAGAPPQGGPGFAPPRRPPSDLPH